MPLDLHAWATPVAVVSVLAGAVGVELFHWGRWARDRHLLRLAGVFLAVCLHAAWLTLRCVLP